MKKCLQTILDFFANIFSLFAQWFARIFNTKQSESMNTTKVHKNIDVFQIDLKEGVTEYFFPKNVDWENKVIDKIVVFAPFYQELLRSPLDSTSVIADRDFIRNLYFDLYNSDDQIIAQNLSATSLIYTNNNPIEIKSKLSLQLSRIFFSGEFPEEGGGALLVYVFYETKELDNFDIPNRSVTVDFKIKEGQEIVLSDIIDTYIYGNGGTLKGIYVWGDSDGVYLTLRDKNFRTIVKYLPDAMMRPPMAPSYYISPVFQWSDVEKIQANPMYFDNEEIDFSNSTIKKPYTRFTDEESIVTITFLY